MGGKWRSVGAVLATTVVTTIAACSAITSFNGLEGSALDAGSSDARANDAQGSSGDASVPDGATIGLDAQSDAPTGPSYCASLSPQPVFCSDFDEPNSIANNWDDGIQTESSNGIDAGIDTLFSTSPPNSFFAVEYADNASGVSAYLQRAFSQTSFTELHLALDVHSESDAYAYFMVITWSAGYFISIVTQAAVNIGTQANNTFVQFSTSVPKNVWTRVYLDVLVTGPNEGSFTVSYGDTNGGTPVVVVNATPFKDPAVSGTPGIAIGMLDSTQAWSAHFDNVTFDLK